jgi:hypothetical protein
MYSSLGRASSGIPPFALPVKRTAEDEEANPVNARDRFCRKTHFEQPDRCPSRDFGVGAEQTEILSTIPRHCESW